MASVMSVEAGRVASVEAGRALIERTGKRHKDTQVAWAKNAPKKTGGLFRMSLNRESSPVERMRWKR